MVQASVGVEKGSLGGELGENGGWQREAWGLSARRGLSHTESSTKTRRD